MDDGEILLRQDLLRSGCFTYDYVLRTYNQSTSHHGIGTLAYAGMNVAGSHAWRSSLSPLATHPFYVAFYRQLQLHPSFSHQSLVVLFIIPQQACKIANAPR